MILVTGATGTVGRELVRLLAERGEQVRAATRSPERARRLLGDIEAVELDYVATETYDAAVQWVDRVFLVPPPFDPNAYETVVPLVDWSVQAGVETIVLLSAMGIEGREDLALRRIERHLESIGIRSTFLRPNLYMQNFTSAFLRDALRADGVFALPAGESRVSFVDGRDVAATAAVALTTPGLDGGTYTLTGPEALGPKEITETLSRAAGCPIHYREVTDDQYRDRLRQTGQSDAAIEVAVEFFRSIREGSREEVTSDVERTSGRAPRTFADFAAEHANLWRPSPPEGPAPR